MTQCVMKLIALSVNVSYRPLMNNFAVYLRGRLDALKEQGQIRSDKDFAALLGIDGSMVSRWTTKGVLPDQDNLEKVLVNLGNEDEQTAALIAFLKDQVPQVSAAQRIHITDVPPIRVVEESRPAATSYYNQRAIAALGLHRLSARQDALVARVIERVATDPDWTSMLSAVDKVTPPSAPPSRQS